MIDILFDIIGSVSNLVKKVADQSPMFLLLIPCLLFGGEMGTVVIVGICIWIFLGGDVEKIREKLSEAEVETKEQKNKTTTRK